MVFNTQIKNPKTKPQLNHMGLPQGKLLLSHLAFLLVASSAELTPAAAPFYHHHHHHYPYHKPHHKHHPHPPIPTPIYPPVKPPVHPPVKPPTKPPVYPPDKPPVHPPVKPPTKSPAYPPVKPPVHPPVKPPTKPPVYPPLKPPVHPPVKPPVYPPVKLPVQPPVKPPPKPPVYPPVKPPAHPPVKPPTYPSVKPPTTPPGKPPTPYHPLPTTPLAVQGVVYCKNCSYLGIDTLLGAKPLPGATVVLRCKNRKPETAKTDKNGYFFLEASKAISSYKATKYCRVTLEAPPLGARCSHRTNLNGGIKGGLLKQQETFAPLPYALFNVGPFAFEPPKHHCRYKSSN